MLVNPYNQVTKYVGALSMQVLGNVKGVFTAVASVLIFQNKVTAIGVMGYAITIFGGVLYHWGQIKQVS